MTTKNDLYKCRVAFAYMFSTILLVSTPLFIQQRSNALPPPTRYLRWTLRKPQPLKPVLLRDITPVRRSIKFVGWGEFRFKKGFTSGLRKPSSYISQLQRKRPGMISDWLKAPKERRIFITGSGKDYDKIQTYIQNNSSNGEQYFFYLDCGRKRCTNEEIGAICATANIILTFPSEAASNSGYIPLENAAIRKYYNLGGEEITAIPVVDLLKMARDRTAMHEARSYSIQKGECEEIEGSEVCNL